MTTLRAFWPLAVIGLAACVGGSSSGGALPDSLTMKSKCSLGAGQSSVLVTEWANGEKANFETLTRTGGIAVEFSECRISLLPDCPVGGAYHWQQTSPASDVVEIKNEMDLYTKLPLGVVSLAGELKRSRSLSVETTISGQLQLYEASAETVPRTPSCERATHVVGGVSLGAYVLSADGSASQGADLNVQSVGELGAKSSSSARVVRSAGLKESCANASAEFADPNCASPIRLILQPIRGKAEEPGPPGTQRVNFVSADPNTRWDVVINDDATCSTPCTKWVRGSDPMSLRSRADDPTTLNVPRVDMDSGPVLVQAHTRSKAKFATSVTFTALGGIGVVTGAALMGIGCSAEDGSGAASLCVPGLYTIVPSAIVTAGAIWLLLDSLPKVKVQPLFGSSMSLGLGNIAGEF